MTCHAIRGLVLLLLLAASLDAAPPQSADTLRVLALRVAFQQDTDETTTGDGLFDLGSSSDPYQIDPPPHNRAYFQDHLVFLKNYFARVSRGALVVESEVYPLGETAAYQLPGDMKSYNPNSSVEAVNEGIARLLRDAVQLADADPAIDFSRYQSVIVFHAGVGKDIDFGFDSTPQDIPSLFVNQNFLQQNLGISSIAVDNGNAGITSGIILPETESQEGVQLGLNGILVSNFASQLGWLDLFSPETRRSGIGRFGLMDAGLFNGDGLLPALPCAWTRIEAGWESSVDIFRANGEAYQLDEVLSASGTRVYRVPINEREYFLLENRYNGGLNLDSLQFVLSEGRSTFPTMKEVLLTALPNAATFSSTTGVLTDIDNPDRGLPGGGILVWHIDEQVIDANRALNRVNNNPARRGVDLEEADGSQDIGAEFDFLSGGSGSETGTSLDLWYDGNNAPLYADPEFAVDPGSFTIRSVPNSRSNINRANSHVVLTNFSGRSPQMSFSAFLQFIMPNFPRQIDLATYGAIRSLRAADLDGNGSEELIMTTDTHLLAMDANGEFPWNGSPEVLTIPGNIGRLIHPPAIFPLSDNGDMAVLFLTAAGEALAWRFNQTTQLVESIFTATTADSNTTWPVALAAPFGNAAGARVYWGSKSGGITEWHYDNGTITTPELFNIAEPVRFVHVLNEDDIMAVGESGTVWVNGSGISTAGAGSYPPVSAGAIGARPDGSFTQLPGPAFTQPEDQVFPFDAPLSYTWVQDPVSLDIQPVYVANGDNRLLVYNQNFTLRSEFPKEIYNPRISNRLSFSPLSAILPGEEDNTNGILVADPAGLLHGFDLSGKPLPDFPLAAGDSLAASPVLLNLDSDGDAELAVVTRTGSVLVWDLSSPFSGANNQAWSQQYANAMNLNLVRPPVGRLPAVAGADLLPGASVYNWPNPNEDNYTFIRYRLNGPAEVTIRIFDLAGDLVTELEGSGYAFTDNEVRWDLGSVQSGVYLARVEARGNNSNNVHIIKIAVVK